MSDDNSLYYIFHIFAFFLVWMIASSLRNRDPNSNIIKWIISSLVVNITYIILIMFEFMNQTKIFANIYAILIINLLPVIFKFNFKLLLWGAVGASLIRNANIIKSKVVPKISKHKYEGEASKPKEKEVKEVKEVKAEGLSLDKSEEAVKLVSLETEKAEDKYKGTAPNPAKKQVVDGDKYKGIAPKPEGK